MFRNNIYSMLTKKPTTIEMNVGTWIVDAVIIWPKIAASSKTLTILLMSKFEWEMAPLWSHKAKAP